MSHKKVTPTSALSTLGCGSVTNVADVRSRKNKWLKGVSYRNDRAYNKVHLMESRNSAQSTLNVETFLDAVFDTCELF